MQDSKERILDPKKLPPKKGKKLRFSKKLDKQARKLTLTTLRHGRKFITSRIDHLSGVRRHIFGWVALTFLLIILSVVQWHAFRAAYVHDIEASGGAYSEGVLGPVETLNPLFARSSAEKSAAKLLFAGLYDYDATGHLRADLAERVVIDGTEKEYTVTLRKGLKWSDGVHLDAKDVVFTVNLLKNDQTKAEITGWRSVSAQVVDATTVKFTLPAPYAPFMHALTFPVLPHHSLSEVHPSSLREHGYSNAPVTSGPFALRLLQNASSDGSKKIVHMAANPHYHRGRAKLERFQLYVYPTREAIVRGLKTSEIMATPELSLSERPEQMKKSHSSQSYAVNNGVYALFNTQSEIMSSKKVRQALVQGVDSAALRQRLDFPTGQLDGPLLADHVNGATGRLPFDVVAAQALLDSEGWVVQGNRRKKADQELSLSLVVLKGSELEKTAQELAKFWRDHLAIGVDIKVVDPTNIEQNVLTSILQPRNFDVLVYELVIGGDPDVYAYWHSSQGNRNGLNFSNYNSAIADDALSGGRARRVSAQRQTKYRAFVRHWQADAPALALYQSHMDYISLSSAHTMTSNAQLVQPVDRFADVIYWTVRHNSVYKTP